MESRIKLSLSLSHLSGTQRRGGRRSWCRCCRGERHGLADTVLLRRCRRGPRWRRRQVVHVHVSCGGEALILRVACHEWSGLKVHGPRLDVGVVRQRSSRSSIQLVELRLREIQLALQGRGEPRVALDFFALRWCRRAKRLPREAPLPGLGRWRGRGREHWRGGGGGGGGGRGRGRGGGRRGRLQHLIAAARRSRNLLPQAHSRRVRRGPQPLERRTTGWPHDGAGHAHEEQARKPGQHQAPPPRPRLTPTPTLSPARLTGSARLVLVHGAFRIGARRAARCLVTSPPPAPPPRQAPMCQRKFGMSRNVCVLCVLCVCVCVSVRAHVCVCVCVCVCKRTPCESACLCACVFKGTSFHPSARSPSSRPL
jgi:hypothetical protein